MIVWYKSFPILKNCTMKNEKEVKRIKPNNLKNGAKNTDNDFMDYLPKDIKESYLKNGYGKLIEQKDGTILAEYIPPFPCND